MQGSCGACLVRIDGRPNLRACRTPASAGMKVERQNAFPSVALDVFGATDFFFPRGMDHHTLLTGAPKPMHAIMQKIARQLAGLGRLPDERPLEIPPARTQLVELVIVGASVREMICVFNGGANDQRLAELRRRLPRATTAVLLFVGPVTSRLSRRRTLPSRRWERV